MPPRSRFLAAILAFLLAAVASAPGALAHAGASIELEAREADACVSQAVCLELVAIPPDLEPGHRTTIELRVHPEASTGYAASATVPDRADPEHEDTPREAAIVTTPRAEPGETVRANLTTPETSHLYVWLPGEDHEARGGWEQVPVGTQTNGETPAGERSASASLSAAVLAVALAAIARRRGWRA